MQKLTSLLANLNLYENYLTKEIGIIINVELEEIEFF